VVARDDSYRSLRFLVIDDNAPARENLRNCSHNFGAFAVDFSSGYYHALTRVRSAPPDVILCEYRFGDERTGQQLLEEMRRERLLPDETVFIMVTAEQSYEHVVAAVELAPDDYVLKPFSPKWLRRRLDKALHRKLFFRPFYAARREGDFEAAEGFLTRYLADEAAAPFRFHLLREQAELQFLKGDPASAFRVYQRILAQQEVPWAMAGSARALLQQNRPGEARNIVERVVDASPYFFDASDLKARICMELGEYAEAQRTIERTSRRTRRNYARKRLLAEAAMFNGDASAAVAAISDVLMHDHSSGAVSVTDRLTLARGLIGARNRAEAEQTLNALQEQDVLAAGVNGEVSRRALIARLDPERHANALDECRRLCTEPHLGMIAKVDLVQAALTVGDAELASRTAESLFASGQIRPVFGVIRELFAQSGLQDAFRAMQKQVALRRIREASRAGLSS